MSTVWASLVSDKRIRTAFTILMWVVVLLLLARVARQAWQGLQVYSLHPSPIPLLLSALMLVVAFLNGAWGWHLLLKAMGVDNAWQEDMTGWLMAQAAKYLPAGTVWYFGGRFIHGRRSGVDSATLSVALALEFGFLLTDALVLFALSAWLWPGIAGGGILSVLTVVVIVLGWLLIPRTVQSVTRLLDQRQVAIADAVRRIQAGRLRRLLFFYLLQWALIGQAFALLVGSVYPILWQQTLAIGGAFSLSAALGYLAIFIPGGWGVREGALTLLLEPFVPVGAMIAILARLWYTAIEGLCVLLGWIIRRIVR